jgi:hypothetical protein
VDRPARSLDAITFDLVLVVVSGILVVSSLGLRPGVGTVPLLVGIPTLVGAVVILGLDLFPRAQRPRPAPAVEPADVTSLPALVAAAVEEVVEDVDISSVPHARRRQLAFAAWTAGFVVLAMLTSFYVAVPVALTVILVAIRLSWVAIALTVGGTALAFYALFDLFLGVRF